MTKGRPADPSRARRGTGNRPAQGVARVRKDAAIVALNPPPEEYPPPLDLPEEAHDLWRTIVADLGGANHMRPSYLPALRAYCEAAYLHAQASAEIRRKGMTGYSPMGSPIVMPAVRIQKDAAATMLRYAESLGLTPAGRIRLGLMEVVGQSLLGALQSSIDGKS